MQEYEVLLLSGLLMMIILVDVLRFPLLKKDPGSRFYKALSIFSSLFVVLSFLITLAKEGEFSCAPGLFRVIWALHFLCFPLLLGMWMHLNAMNVLDDPKMVTVLGWLHAIPFCLLVVLIVWDIPRQQFYPVGEGGLHLLPSAGTNYMMILSLFYCLAMILSTLGHLNNLQGSFLFISALLPSSFLTALISFWITKSYGLFLVVNVFMLVLYYVVGQRDSITFDRQTGLPTKALLDRKLTKIFRLQALHAVIIVEIENYPQFCNRYGQSVADQMIQEVSNYLRSFAGPNELFCLASDCFYLCFQAKEAPVVGTLVKQMHKRFEDGWVIDSQPLYVQGLIGLLQIPQQASSLSEFRLAEEQLKREMRAVRKGSVVVYTREYALLAQRRQNIITALRDSIRFPEQIKVYYQPVYDVHTGAMVSAEALIRIDDASLGFLEPKDFMHLAEQSGLIMHLTKLVLRQVCGTIRCIPMMGERPQFITVNLSGEDFSSRMIGKTLLDIIEREGVNPKHIGFEVTETVVLQSYQKVADVMIRFSENDISFSLDDFGSGYSHLKALGELPYTYVKFDKSLIEQSSFNPTMLALLTDMLHKMGKCIIAEGVETEEHLNIVRELGIERVQGFYFAKPMEEATFLQLCAE